MGNTTSNQDRVVATQGTPHIAKTQGATDTCIDPSTGATSSFNNQIATSLLTPGTCNTLVAQQKIWTSPHVIGPPSQPPHPPFIVGTVSGTHIMEAKATSYSCNVFAEGNALVRTNDATTQNHGNTPGIVDGSALAGSSNASQDFLNKQCTIIELTGINEVSGEAPDGVSTGKPAKAARPLGYPGPKENKPPYYLEILSATTVKCKAVRKDVTPGAGDTNPKCYKGTHTEWTAKRTGFQEATAKTVQGKDDYDVTEELTSLIFDDIDSLKETVTGLKGPGDLYDKVNKPEGTETTDKMVKPTKYNPKVAVTKKTTVNSMEGIADSLEAIIALFTFKTNPVNINVQALSCGGSRNAQLRVFPAQQVDFTLNFSEETLTVSTQTKPGHKKGYYALQTAIGALKKMKDVAGVAQKVANLAKYPIKLEFIKGTSINFKLGYKPCTEEKKGFFGNYYTPSHCGLPWSLTWTSSVLIGFSIEFSISLINLVAPGIGEGAATALRRLGVRVDLVFTAKLSVPLNVSIGMDEYEYFTQTGVEISVNPTLGIAIKVGTGINLLAFGANFPMSLSAGFFGGDKPKVLIQLQPKGSLKTVLFLTILEDTWFEKTWEKEPEDWQLHWNGPKIDVWTVA